MILPMPTHRQHFLTLLKLLSLCLSVAFCPAVSFAVEPADGYFYGVNLEPVGDANISTVEGEPAVALIFAADQKTADITRQFDEWYASAGRPEVGVYAIAVEPPGIARDVVLEAINQRNLRMPVFLSHSDMLLGDDYRLLVLNNDQEVARFTTLDLAGVNTALAGLGVAIPEVATPPAATVIEPAVPGENTTVSVESETGTLPDGSTYSTVTTTTRSRSESIILGGDDGEPIYKNDTYGMQVEFPPGWQYQVAAKNDGAVAMEPRGSQMDMRVWALPASGVDDAQEYIDQNLESLARKYRTRVNVERKIIVRDGNLQGVDITYNYARPIDESAPARGGLVYRGRMQVFVDAGMVKAASVSAPSGEFMASFPLVESFFHSFQVEPGHNPPLSEYDSPDTI